MDALELLETARIGRMDRLKYLVETKDVNLNVRDRWDATPLYYACLCGHEKMVQYLVEHGARCQANTFDGERCLFAALTPGIKRILKEANLINAKIMRRDSFEEFLRQLLQSRKDFADVRFDVHGEKILAHKCVLYARSKFFAEKLRTKWRVKSVIRLNSLNLIPWAFQAYIQYLYTGVFDIGLDQVEDVIKLLETVKELELIDQIKERVKRAEKYKKLKRGGGSKNFAQVVLSVEMPDSTKILSNDLSILSTAALPKALSYWTDGSELPFMEDRPACSPFSDVCFYVDGYSFFCHKAFFCGRSEFFRALVDDHFMESDAIACSPTDAFFESVENNQNDFPYGQGLPTPPSSNPATSELGHYESHPHHDTGVSTLPLIRLHSVTHEVFKQIVNYVYTNNCQLEENTVYEVLEAADQYLLQGLKSICGTYMAEHLDTENVVVVLETARLLSLPRLEEACYAFIADHLKTLSKSTALHRLIINDAAEVKNRDIEKGDSIQVVDEIRFHISSNFKSWSDVEVSERLVLVDDLMGELKFDGCRQKETPESELKNNEASREWEPDFMMEMPQDEDILECV